MNYQMTAPWSLMWRNLEADDLISILASQSSDKCKTRVIYSIDKDLLQVPCSF